MHERRVWNKDNRGIKLYESHIRDSDGRGLSPYQRSFDETVRVFLEGGTVRNSSKLRIHHIEFFGSIAFGWNKFLHKSYMSRNDFSDDEIFKTNAIAFSSSFASEKSNGAHEKLRKYSRDLEIFNCIPGPSFKWTKPKRETITTLKNLQIDYIGVEGNQLNNYYNSLYIFILSKLLRSGFYPEGLVKLDSLPDGICYSCQGGFNGTGKHCLERPIYDTKTNNDYLLWNALQNYQVRNRDPRVEFDRRNSSFEDLSGFSVTNALLFDSDFHRKLQVELDKLRRIR